MNREMINGIEQYMLKHFRKLRALERKRKLVERKEKRIDKIEKDIKNCQYKMETRMGAIRYDVERVSGGEIKSSVESALLKAHDNLEDKKADLITDINFLKIEIEDMYSEVSEMEELLSNLSDEDNLLLSYRYGERLTLEAVGEKLGWSQSQVSRNRDRIIIWVQNEIQA